MQENINHDDKRVSFGDVRDYFIKLIKDFIDLSHGVDKWGTIREIKSKQAMSGANAWMLMCSIVIVSIGLNLNSEAVIIGAMLISPLMSPILGIGLAVGINDKDALYHALMHFGAAILIAIIFSTIYFLLTPLDEFTEQISARTAPTFLDVFIGIFGGIAGIISIARKDISTTLPGVAIATALMPPLCVCGYGFAHGNLDIATRSFYLFFLNSFFVAFATYLIVRYLKFPYKTYASKKEKRKNLYIVVFFVSIMIIPSFIIFWDVFKEARNNRRVDTFIRKYIGPNYIFLDDHELIHLENDSQKLILKVYGDSINRSKIPYYEEGLKSLSVENTTIDIIPTSEINLTKIRQLENELSGLGDQLENQIVKLEAEKAEQLEYINEVEGRDDIMKLDSAMFADVCKEINIFIPEIRSLRLGVSRYSDFNSTSDQIPLVIADWPRPNNKEKEQLRSYLKAAYQLDTLVVLIE